MSTTSPSARFGSRAILAIVVAMAFAASASESRAQSGSWSQNGLASPYAWSLASNWSGGIIADGMDNTATFATAGLQGPLTIDMDTARTLGNLFFDNPTNANSWTITSSTAQAMTLQTTTGTPTV